jgi:hypothetical protein
LGAYKSDAAVFHSVKASGLQRLTDALDVLDQLVDPGVPLFCLIHGISVLPASGAPLSPALAKGFGCGSFHPVRITGPSAGLADHYAVGGVSGAFQ